ncbi:MAG: efflux RND transporter permease subunit [Patescibacteria group bacterium]
MKKKKTNTIEEQQQKESMFVGITRMFLGNRPMAVLLLIFVILAGFFSWAKSPKQLNPEIELPQFVITTVYPGATAQEVETFVTKELEEVVSDLEGVDEVNSFSVDGGVSTVYVSFKDTVSEETAKTQLRSKIDENLAVVKTEGLTDPLIQPVSIDLVPTLVVAFTSDSLHQDEVRELVVELMNDLKQVDKTANLNVHGGNTPEFRIALDPGKMQKNGISASDVELAIIASNIKVPAGAITNGNTVIKVGIDGTIKTLEDAGNIVVSPGIKLSDIATLEEFKTERNKIVQIHKDGESKDVVILSLSKRIGEDVIETMNTAIATLDTELAKEKYSALDVHENDKRYSVIQDDATMTQILIDAVLENLFQSIFIVFLVLLIFLTSRAAINVALAIPITILATLFVNYAAGYSVSLATLLAFIVALGLLVDGATVMVESSYRNIQEAGEDTPKWKSILKAAQNNAGGLFVSTLTSAVVFVPIAYIEGLTGQYMFPMAFIVPTSLFLSTFFALSIIPFFSDSLLEKEEKKKEEKKDPDFFDRLSEKYADKLTYLLDKDSRQNTFIFVTIAALVFSFSLIIFGFVKQSGMTAAETEQYFIFVNAPETVDMPEVYDMVKEVTNEVVKEEEVISAISFQGEAPVDNIEFMSKGSPTRILPNQASIYVHLTNTEDRDITNQEIVNQVRERLTDNETLNEYVDEGAVISVFVDSGGLNGAGKIQHKVFGPDPKIREEVAKDIYDVYSDTEGITHVDSTVDHGQPKILYRIDHEKALSFGVSSIEVSKALVTALGPHEVGTYHTEEGNEAAPIYMQFDFEDRNSIDDLSSIYVKSITGVMVPLDSVVEKVQTRNEPVRERENRRNVTKVIGEDHIRSSFDIYGELDEKMATYEFPYEGKLLEEDAVKKVYELPNGDLYSIEWGGEKKETIEINQDLAKAFIAAFVILYCLLVLQFKSFVTPLVVMTTIPLGFIGIFPTFFISYHLFGIPFDPPVMIGFIALMGIVVNNSIMILEYFEMYKKDGMETKEALIQAGKVRLRPILLTTATTVLGVVPLVTEPGWGGTAIAIIFGLSTSVAFTIFLIPVIYNKFQGEGKSKKKKKTSKK